MNTTDTHRDMDRQIEGQRQSCEIQRETEQTDIIHTYRYRHTPVGLETGSAPAPGTFNTSFLACASFWSLLVESTDLYHCVTSHPEGSVPGPGTVTHLPACSSCLLHCSNCIGTLNYKQPLCPLLVGSALRRFSRWGLG